MLEEMLSRTDNIASILEYGYNIDRNIDLLNQALPDIASQLLRLAGPLMITYQSNSIWIKSLVVQ